MILRNFMARKHSNNILDVRASMKKTIVDDASSVADSNLPSFNKKTNRISVISAQR